MNPAYQPLILAASYCQIKQSCHINIKLTKLEGLEVCAVGSAHWTCWENLKPVAQLTCNKENIALSELFDYKKLFKPYFQNKYKVGVHTLKKMLQKVGPPK